MHEEPDIRAIERTFLRLDDGESGYPKCSVSIEIADLGCWIVKFTKNGVVVNNNDLIFRIDPNETDANIKFKSHSVFWTTLNGGERYDDGVTKGLIKQTGSSVVVELLKRKLFKTSDIVDIGTNSSSNSGAIQVPRRLSNPAELAVHMPIKSGWLLKKRDIIFGWQCRYFVVYVGRVEYFIDQHDQLPRGVIQLFGADIRPASKCTVNGVHDHWAISIEPRNREKAFRLASELTGDEGLTDAASWVQVFMSASKTGDGIYGPYHPIRNQMEIETKPSNQKLDMNLKQINDKERIIRKNTFIDPAVIVAVVSVILGVVGGNLFYRVYPESTLLKLLGVVLFVAALTLAGLVLGGFFDFASRMSTSSAKERRRGK